MALAITFEITGTLGGVQTVKTFFFCDGLVGPVALHTLAIRYLHRWHATLN